MGCHFPAALTYDEMRELLVALLACNRCDGLAAFPATFTRRRSRWSVREHRTSNFAMVEFYSSDWLAPIDNTGKKSGGLRDNCKAGLSKVQANLNLGVGLMYT